MTTEPEATMPDQADRKSSGFLKWGLIGCALLSAVLIVLLVVLGMRAKSLLGWALARVEDQVLAGCAPEVTPAEKEAFRGAFASLVERAKAGKAAPDEIRAFQKKVLGAMADGKVTPEELRMLTAEASRTPVPQGVP